MCNRKRKRNHLELFLSREKNFNRFLKYSPIYCFRNYEQEVDSPKFIDPTMRQIFRMMSRFHWSTNFHEYIFSTKSRKLVTIRISHHVFSKSTRSELP